MEKKYLQIKQYILKMIDEGEFVENLPITSERDLAELFQLNRMTVRRGIEELMYEGILVRKKGVGTFLNQSKASKNLWGETPARCKNTIKVIAYQKEVATQYGSQVLQVEKGETHYRLKRVRRSDQIPYAYEDIYFHPTVSLLSEADCQLGLRQLIKCKLPENIVHIEESVEALLCLHHTAEILGVKTGSPILQVKSNFECEGKIWMHCRSYHPGDSYRYERAKVRLE